MYVGLFLEHPERPGEFAEISDFDGYCRVPIQPFKRECCFGPAGENWPLFRHYGLCASGDKQDPPIVVVPIGNSPFLVQSGDCVTIQFSTPAIYDRTLQDRVRDVRNTHIAKERAREDEVYGGGNWLVRQ